MTTPRASIEAHIASQLEELEAVTIRSLQTVGEQAVNKARSAQGPNPSIFKGRIPPHQPNFIDWSGNLRSSIGYVIVKDGKVVTESSFEQVKDGKEGAKEGASFARQLAKKFPSGIALIVVAGMNYAYYVKKRGYDVIDGGELLARQLVPQLLGELGYKVL